MAGSHATASSGANEGRGDRDATGAREAFGTKVTVGGALGAMETFGSGETSGDAAGDASGQSVGAGKSIGAVLADGRADGSGARRLLEGAVEDGGGRLLPRQPPHRWATRTVLPARSAVFSTLARNASAPSTNNSTKPMTTSRDVSSPDRGGGGVGSGWPGCGPDGRRVERIGRGHAGFGLRSRACVHHAHASARFAAGLGDGSAVWRTRPDSNRRSPA